MKQVALKTNLLLLTSVAFFAAFFVALPAEAAVLNSASTATSPAKVYCVSSGQNFAVGTERTSIINASGTASVIADGRFVCRVKDGRGVWEREGSLPGKPTNPICIKGKMLGVGTTTGASRPITQECLGGNGSSTSIGGGAGTPKPGVSPIHCRWFNKVYQEGASRPTAGFGTSMRSRMTPIICQDGQWRPVKEVRQGNHSASAAASSTKNRSGFGTVKGASTDIYLQMAAVITVIQEEVNALAATK